MLPTGWRLWLPFLLSLLLTVTILPPQAAAGELGAYQAGIDPAAVFSGAERFGPVEGTPPAQAAYKDGKVVGYVFVTSDIGYSGKPIRVLAGMDTDGLITGAKVVEHHEPILLVGIPQEKLFDYVGRYVGQRVTDLARTGAGKPPVDIIAGATVTVVVLNDGLIRTAVRIARARGIAGFKPVAAATESVTLAERPFRKADWPALLGDGAVRRLHLDNADVDQAFAKLGIGSGEPYTVPSVPANTFIDLYAALVTPESIGRNLLGDNEYEQLRRWLKPGQQALLIFAEGEYSFRGSGYVRGGIFDRFQVIQDDVSILFHDKDYRRIGAIEAEGAPAFPEIGLFRIPQGVVFDPAKPWRMELLAQRPTGPIQKAFTSFSLDYQLPEAYLLRKLVASPAQPTAAQAAPAEGAQALESYADEGPREPLWVGIWRARVVDIAILSISLTTLTLIFFFQDILVRRPKLFDRLRLGFLAFTVLWIGGYAQAQLSVVNVLTFANALMTGFRWDFFLLEPLIFILWCATAISMLFWGRGVFCGWLCPFGALQELLNKAARQVGIRQITVKWFWHERLWPIKYILFLGLFALSLSSMATAERFAEVEPFKTVVLLHFARDWPFVIYALTLLAGGLVMERFFCRYLCPLGGALAIPGKGRLFDWLKRRKQCGSECSLCARNCQVQAIDPLGRINVNECLYCMDCQVTYSDDTRCPPLIQRRQGRGRKAAPAAARPSEAQRAE